MAVGGGTALGHPRGRLCSPETHAFGFSGFFPLMRKEVQLAAQNEGTEWSSLSTLAEGRAQGCGGRARPWQVITSAASHTKGRDRWAEPWGEGTPGAQEMNAKINPKWHKKERHHASRSVGWRRLVPMATGHRGSRQAAWPRQGGPGRSHRAPSTRPRHGGRTPAAPRPAWRRVPWPPWDAQGAPSRRGWSGGPRGDAPRKRAGQTQKRGDGAPRRLTLLLCRPSVRLHAGGCRGQRRWSCGRRVAGGASRSQGNHAGGSFRKREIESWF